MVCCVLVLGLKPAWKDNSISMYTLSCYRNTSLTVYHIYIVLYCCHRKSHKCTVEPPIPEYLNGRLRDYPDKHACFQMLAYINLYKSPHGLQTTWCSLKTSFPVPERYKIHSIMQTFNDHFLKIFHHHRWIQRLSIILALSLVNHASLSDYHRATERSENAASSCLTARVHVAILTRSVP